MIYYSFSNYYNILKNTLNINNILILPKLVNYINIPKIVTKFDTKNSLLNNYIYLNYIKNLFNNKKFIQKNSQNENIKKIILHVNKTSLTLKSGRLYNYKIITGIGTEKKWLGIGENKSKLFKQAYTKSVLFSKKYIYNLKFIYNDFKKMKYKSSQILLLDKNPNKYNLKIYDNIINLTGLSKSKLIPYKSKNPLNLLKLFLHSY